MHIWKVTENNDNNSLLVRILSIIIVLYSVIIIEYLLGQTVLQLCACTIKIMIIGIEKD